MGITVEIKDTRNANLVRDAIGSKVIELQSLLHTEVASTSTPSGMDMTSITEMVTDINMLNEIRNQIEVKLQFITTE